MTLGVSQTQSKVCTEGSQTDQSTPPSKSRPLITGSSPHLSSPHTEYYKRLKHVDATNTATRTSVIFQFLKPYPKVSEQAKGIEMTWNGRPSEGTSHNLEHPNPGNFLKYSGLIPDLQNYLGHVSLLLPDQRFNSFCFLKIYLFDLYEYFSWMCICALYVSPVPWRSENGNILSHRNTNAN